MAAVSDLLRVKGIKVFSVSPDMTIRETLKVMADNNIGALPVIKGNELVGIFSERDLARLLAKSDRSELDTLISNVMTKKVITVKPATDLEECMELMTEKHIRHLPVVDKKKLVGLISIGDVVKLIISTQKDFIKQLEGYISGSW